jgi:hypothetical protein
MQLSHLLGAALGSTILFLAASSGASANDSWRYRERHHWRHEHPHHEHWRHERPAVVRERPMVVERARPVFIQPQPIYMAPMMPQGPSGLNLNFNIPLR